MGRHGQSLLRHDHAHSQISAPVLPAPQFTQFLLERFDIEGNLCLSLVRCLAPVTLAASGDFSLPTYSPTEHRANGKKLPTYYLGLP